MMDGLCFWWQRYHICIAVVKFLRIFFERFSKKFNDVHQVIFVFSYNKDTMLKMRSQVFWGNFFMIPLLLFVIFHYICNDS